jgi:hypothetical protein
MLNEKRQNIHRLKDIEKEPPTEVSSRIWSNWTINSASLSLFTIYVTKSWRFYFSESSSSIRMDGISRYVLMESVSRIMSMWIHTNHKIPKQGSGFREVGKYFGYGNSFKFHDCLINNDGSLTQQIPLFYFSSFINASRMNVWPSTHHNFHFRITSPWMGISIWYLWQVVGCKCVHSQYL